MFRQIHGEIFDFNNIFTIGRNLWMFYILYSVSSHGRHLDGGHRGRDSMVVGFTTTYAISVYHH
jgi:hypothetical protein